MNGFTHFLTGLLVARALGYRSKRFEAFYTSFAGIIPDLDFTIQHVYPALEHGVFTHTLVGGTMLSLVVALVAWAIMTAVSKDFKAKSGLSLARLFGLAMLGVASHFVLDSFTYYSGPGDATHHVYFWPVWDFAPHINTLFPGATWEVRVAVEVIYTVIIAAFILFYLWPFKRENPFIIVSPWHWRVAILGHERDQKAPALVKAGIASITIGAFVVGLLLLDVASAFLLAVLSLSIFYYLDVRRTHAKAV